MTKRQNTEPYKESARQFAVVQRDLIEEERRKTGKLNAGERYSEWAIAKHKETLNRYKKGGTDDVC